MDRLPRRAQRQSRISDALRHPTRRTNSVGPSRLPLWRARRLRNLLVSVVHAPARRAPGECPIPGPPLLLELIPTLQHRQRTSESARKSWIRPKFKQHAIAKRSEGTCFLRAEDRINHEETRTNSGRHPEERLRRRRISSVLRMTPSQQSNGRKD